MLNLNLHPAYHHPARIRNVDNDFAKELDFKDIKFPVKTRDIDKVEKNNSIAISPLPLGYENKKYPICLSKKCLDSDISRVFLGAERKNCQNLCLQML